LPWTVALAALAFGANLAFLVALRMTSTSSAVALEQLCSLFIAALSWLLLRARYHPVAIVCLLVAVTGAVLAVMGDAWETVGAGAMLWGDFMSLVVAVCAGLYMVLFKRAFPDMSAQEFLFYFTLKALVTVAFGWIAVLAFNLAGWEVASFPTTGCGAFWLPMSTLCGALFNWSLAWVTLKLSPLTARLSLLLGIPCTFVVDVLSGVNKGTSSVVGVALVLLGVIGFEAVSARAAPRKPRRSDAAPNEAQVQDAAGAAEQGQPLAAVSDGRASAAGMQQS